MMLRQLQLRHFGKFASADFTFRRGVNLLIGPNEAGKSTLMEAIPAALFGMRNKDRFRPWGWQGSSAVTVTLQTGSEMLRIEREILQDQILLSQGEDLDRPVFQFEGKASPQGRSAERSEYLGWLEKGLGFAQEELFRASVFFGQGSLELPGQGGVTARIKTLLSGAVEVDYEQVLASLRNDLFAVTRSNPWGKDKTNPRELEELRSRLKVLEQEWFGAQKHLAELAQLREEKGGVEAALEADRAEYAQGERYLAWVRKQYHLQEKGSSLQKNFDRVNRQSEKVSQLEGERQRLEKELTRTGLPRQIPEDLILLLSDADKGRQDLIALQTEAAPLRDELLRQPALRWWPVLLLSLALVAAGGALGWLWPAMRQLLAFGFGLATILAWSWFLVRAGRRRAERSRLQGKLEILEGQRAEVQGELAALDGRFESLGLSPSAVEIVKMQKNLTRHRQLADELREIESALKVLEEAPQLSRERDDLTRELAVLDVRREQEQTPAPAHLLAQEDLPAAEAQWRSLGEKIRAQEAQVFELTRQEARLQAELPDLQQIEDEGEVLREREQFLLQRQKSLTLGHDLLAGAVEEFRQTYLQRFADQIGHHLGIVTAGRHAQVHLDDDFCLFLQGGDGEWHPLDRFSRGTVDATCLAVRLALAQHLSRGRSLPLFLDDPLVNFDAQRLRETLTVLERIGMEHQVLLFTHDQSLKKGALQRRWNVITLDEMPSAVAAEERRDDAGQLYLL